MPTNDDTDYIGRMIDELANHYDIDKSIVDALVDKKAEFVDVDLLFQEIGNLGIF